MSKLMVLGMGNILNHDGGLGIYAVRDLCRENWPKEVIFLDKRHLETNHGMPLFQGQEFLLILDVLQAGYQPGTMYRLSIQELMEKEYFNNDGELWNMLTLSELLGERIKVVFLGLEPEKTDWELNLSPSLQKVYADYLESVRHELRALLGLQSQCEYMFHSVGNA
jgi:hydrogenase maturation protease